MRVRFVIGVLFLVAIAYFGGCLCLGLLSASSRDARALRKFEILLPNDQGQLCLFCRPKPRGIPFEGYSRALQFVRPDGKEYWLRFPETCSGDKNIILIFWYGPQNLIRLHDVGVRDQYECVLGIPDGHLRYLLRNKIGTFWGVISKPTDFSQALVTDEKTGILFPRVENGFYESKNVPIIDGRLSERIIQPWKDTEGIFVGILGDPLSEIEIQKIREKIAKRGDVTFPQATNENRSFY